MTRSDQRLLWLSLAVIAALVVSGVEPYDRTTWILEVAPVLIALPILFFTRESFPLTPLLYLVIGLHCLVLILGGAYTYARVPLGYWLQDLFELTRNPYDKIGHFMQGFTPALLARELFMRNGHVNGAKMSAFLAVCVSLAVSAVYELIEWWAALALGQGADEFLGTQGDMWDTQSDMFLALLGAGAALALLGGLQQRQAAALRAR
jgi:putative membrane protein